MNMCNGFRELKEITDYVYSKLEKAGRTVPYGIRVVALLDKFGIKIRQKDRKLAQINISIPQSQIGVVLGLRYLKNVGRKTEDLFFFQEGKEITTVYSGKSAGPRGLSWTNGSLFPPARGSCIERQSLMVLNPPATLNG